MNNQPETPSPRHLPEELFELRLKKAAKGMIYPDSPLLSGAVLAGLVTRRPRVVRMGWVIAGILLALVLAAGLAVPSVRAAVLDWIRIGAVRIYLVQPSPTPTPTVEATPTPVIETPATSVPSSASDDSRAGTG